MCMLKKKNESVVLDNCKGKGTNDKGWKTEAGRWLMEDRGQRMEDRGWTEDGGRRGTEDGGRRMGGGGEDGGRMTDDGGRRMEDRDAGRRTGAGENLKTNPNKAPAIISSASCK